MSRVFFRYHKRHLGWFLSFVCGCQLSVRRDEPVEQFATSTEGKVFTWPFILGHECSSEPRALSDCLYQSWHLLDLVASLILLAKMTEVLEKKKKIWIFCRKSAIQANGSIWGMLRGLDYAVQRLGKCDVTFWGCTGSVGVGLQAMEGHSPISYCKYWDWRCTGIQPLLRCSFQPGMCIWLSALH